MVGADVPRGSCSGRAAWRRRSPAARSRSVTASRRRMFRRLPHQPRRPDRVIRVDRSGCAAGTGPRRVFHRSGHDNRARNDDQHRENHGDAKKPENLPPHIASPFPTTHSPERNYRSPERASSYVVNIILTGMNPSNITGRSYLCIGPGPKISKQDLDTAPRRATRGGRPIPVPHL